MTIEAFLADNREAIIAAVVERVRDSPMMAEVAASRELGRDEMSAQIVRFWLDAVGSDLAIGSTAVMAQNLMWLKRLRAGHGLPFEDDAPGWVFDQISDEIESRVDDPLLRAECARYRSEIHMLLAETFPG